MSRKVLITGAFGFIGSHLVEACLDRGWELTLIDNLTYAANSYKYIDDLLIERYPYKVCSYVRYDIVNTDLYSILNEHKPDYVFHLAAETHVDQSIKDPGKFFRTNVMGTFNLVDSFRRYVKEHDSFLVHVSTDEVFGEAIDEPFNEKTPYNPRSPYSASKASSDHIVRSYIHTFNIPAIITNCCNNYGARQNNEKFIPKIISHAREGKKIPVYGNGLNIREWIYVKDHVEALIFIAENKDRIKEHQIVIGSDEYYPNIEIVHKIGEALKMPVEIEYVEDRLGHDKVYRIDSSLLQSYGFKIKTNMADGLAITVREGLTDDCIFQCTNIEELFT